jgi:hypothetical protein
MTDRDPVSEESIDAYQGASTPWSEVRRRLDGPDGAAAPGNSFWLATTRPDGRPHVVGIGAMWSEGRFWFVAGPGTVRARNLAANPACVIALAPAGLDLTVEGTATKVTDEATLQRLADLYATHGWAPTVRDGAFVHEYSAPSAGPPPWELYEMTPTAAIAIATGDPYAGATRYRFA